MVEPAIHHDPDKQFRREWAYDLLTKATASLELWYTKENRLALFQKIRGCIVRGGGEKYEKIAADLRMTIDQIKKAVIELRQRYQIELRNHVASTVSEPNQVEDEIRDLFNAVREG